MPSQRPTVAVVGAGFAGLAVARQLAQRGFPVSVLERADRVGGVRAGQRLEGFQVEPAGPLLSSADHVTLDWIAAVGRRDEMLPLRPVLTSLVHRGEATAVDAREPGQVAGMPGVRPLQAARLVRLPRLMKRYAAGLDPDAPAAAAPQDDRSLADFCRTYFGQTVLDRWMGPAVTATALGDARETSRVLFLRRHHVHADARMGLPRGTFADLAHAAADDLSVRTSAGVEGVERRSDGGYRLLLDGARALEADAVVFALPAPESARIAAPVLASAEHDVLRRVAYTPALVLALGLRRPFHPHPQRLIFTQAEGSPLETALLEPGVAGGRVPEGRGLALLTATTAFSHAAWGVADDVVTKELLYAYEQLHPSVHGARLFTRLFRQERALPLFGVGHYRDIARLDHVERDRRAAGRRVYLTGDYRVEPTLEGALRAAGLTADAVAEDLGE